MTFMYTTLPTIYDECGICGQVTGGYLLADILAVGSRLACRMPSSTRFGRYGSADDCQLTVNLVEPKRERRIAGLATGGCLYNLGVIAPMMYVFMCSEKRPLVGDLVRIDGERTTSKDERTTGQMFPSAISTLAHYSYVWSPKPSAAAVIHMG